MNKTNSSPFENLRSIIIALVAITILAGNAQAATYYVSASGMSGNPGTEASPWSLGKANATLAAGDTAILMDGSYNTQIMPANSGTAGSVITYIAQNSRMAELTTGNPRILVDDRSYITIDGMKALHGFERWLHGNNASHITINDCEFIGGFSGSFEKGRFRDSGGYIHITNSTFDGQADGITICEGKGHYIANNFILRDAHSPMVVKGISESVIENNRFDTDIHRNLEVLSTPGYLPPNERRTNYIIIQGNYFRANKPLGAAAAIKLSGSYTILRRNVFDNCSVRGVGLGNSFGSKLSYRPEGWFSEYNRIYNNSFNGCQESIKASRSNGTVAAGGAYGNHISVNNIIYGGIGDKQVYLSIDTQPEDLAFYYNSILRTAPGQDSIYVNGLTTLAQVESAYPAYFANNYEFNPLFTDAAAEDFTLQPGSPCIDAGGPLTRTVGAGSGRSFTVEDSLFFTDGYGLIDPDVIRVGNNRVQIVSVDHDNNWILIDSTITWSDGDPVYLDYLGEAPDLGAFESGSNETVVGRSVFYNNSEWDGNDPAINAADNDALADNKLPLMPRQRATFDNYTSYIKGINGIMIDFINFNAPPTVDDFAFKVGNVSNLSGFTAAPAPTGFAYAPGGAAGGPDRVTITFADGAIVGKWLQVIHIPTSDMFYFGNAPGETGDEPEANAMVTAQDEVVVTTTAEAINIGPASIRNPGDFDRDKKVAPTDAIISRNNCTDSGTALRLINPFVNFPPTAVAGDNDVGIVGSAVPLVGQAADDGYPFGTLVTTWSKISGTGSVSFSNANALDSTATFTAADTYTLQLHATDGQYAVTDTVEISISAPTTGDFVDDFDDGDISDWTALFGGMIAIQYPGTPGYEICPTGDNSRISKVVDGSSFADTVYISFTIRHTKSGSGWKHGILWLVDSSGAGFGVLFGLVQTGNGALEILSTTDNGTNDGSVGPFTPPGPAGGTDMKTVELIYDRTANTAECYYEGVSMGIVDIDPDYADFSKVVIYLKKPYTSSERINFDNLRIADTPLGG